MTQARIYVALLSRRVGIFLEGKNQRIKGDQTAQDADDTLIQVAKSRVRQNSLPRGGGIDQANYYLQPSDGPKILGDSDKRIFTNTAKIILIPVSILQDLVLASEAATPPKSALCKTT